MLKRLLPIITLAVLGATAAGAQTTAAPAVSSAEAQPELIVAPSQKQEQVFRYVEQMPSFKSDVNSYLAKHITYPATARKAGAEGRAIVSFIVTDKGVVKDVSVTRSSGNAALDAEAVRVVNTMNAPDGSAMWNAGRNNGMAVNCYFMLPVTFTLTN